MNKKLKQSINVHKILTKKIADGEYTMENNEKALHKQQILGEEIALVLAGFKCEKCPSEDNLTIHHMIMRANKDYVSFNKYWSQRRYFFNIAVLCKKHHNGLNHYGLRGVKEEKFETISQKNIDKIKKKYGFKEKEGEKE